MLRFKSAGVVAWLLMVIFKSGAAYCAPSQPPMRIVSLAPAVTEMLFALGLGERVVGVSSNCDRPAGARKKPRVGGMANPSLEAILALKPDMIVVTRDGNPKNIADRLTKLGKNIYAFQTTRLNELPSNIRDMGNVLGAQEAADKMAKRIEDAMLDASRHSVQKDSARRTKTLFVIWTKPLIVAGPDTIINDAMTGNGLSNIAGDTKVPYPNFSLEAVINRKPDLIIIGAAHDPDMKAQSQAFLKRLGMLDAVQKGHVCYVGDALYRPGPRIAEGLAELKRCRTMP